MVFTQKYKISKTINCATVQQFTTSCFGVMPLVNCKLKTHNYKTDNFINLLQNVKKLPFYIDIYIEMYRSYKLIIL